MNQNWQYQCPAGGFYIYSGNRVGCSIYDDIEDHVVCTYSRKSSGVIGYSSGTAVCSVHHGSHGGGDEDEDEGTVPFL